MRKNRIILSIAFLAAAAVISGCVSINKHDLISHVFYPDNREPLVIDSIIGREKAVEPGGRIIEKGTAIPVRFIRIFKDTLIGAPDYIYTWPAGDYEVIGSSPAQVLGAKFLVVSDTSAEGNRMKTRLPKRFPLSLDHHFEIAYLENIPPEEQLGVIHYPSASFAFGYGGKIDLSRHLFVRHEDDPDGTLELLEYLGRDGFGAKVRYMKKRGHDVVEQEDAVLKPSKDGICTYRGASFKIVKFDVETMTAVPLKNFD